MDTPIARRGRKQRKSLEAEPEPRAKPVADVQARSEWKPRSPAMSTKPDTDTQYSGPTKRFGARSAGASVPS